MNKKQMGDVRNEYKKFLKNAEKEGFRELTEDELRLEVNGGRDKCKNDKDSNDGKGSEDKRDKKERSDKDKKEGGGAEKKERGVIDRIKDCFGRSNKDKDRSEAKEKSTEQKEKGLLGKAWDGIKDFFSGDKSKEEEKKAEENDSNLNKNGKAKSEENASVKSSQNDELAENSESQDMSTQKHGASDADGKNKTEKLGTEAFNNEEQDYCKSTESRITDFVNKHFPKKVKYDKKKNSLGIDVNKNTEVYVGIPSAKERYTNITSAMGILDTANSCCDGDVDKVLSEFKDRIDYSSINSGKFHCSPSMKIGIEFKF